MKWISTALVLVTGLASSCGSPPGAAPPVNMIRNGGVEGDSTGWLLVEKFLAGTKWGTSQDAAVEGRRGLFIDRRDAIKLDHAVTWLQSPWFEHPASPLLVSAMVRSNGPGEIAMGFTHGEIAKWKGRNPLTVRQTFEIGPEWRRITLRVPQAINRPRKDFGSHAIFDRAGHTKGMAYIELTGTDFLEVDNVQAVVGSASDPPTEPPPYAPSAEVELGWTVEENGITHGEPRFEALIASHKSDAWSGALHYSVKDHFDRTVQEEMLPVEAGPRGGVSVPVTVRTKALGIYKVALSLVDRDGRETARDAFTLLRTEKGAGSDAIAVTTAGMAESDNRVNAPRMIAQLGFVQIRLYNVGSWIGHMPGEGEWVSHERLYEKFFGDTPLRALVNFSNSPKWVNADKFRYPLGSIDQFTKYVRRAAVELRPWLSAVSFANEPNAHFRGDAENFIAYEEALYNAIKAVAPEVDVAGIQVGSGSLGGHINYVQDMFDVGGQRLAEMMDVLAIQTHLLVPFEQTRWPVILKRTRALADRYGIDRIWTTEMGYDVFAPMEEHMPVRARARTNLVDLISTERPQADRLTRAALYSLATTFERFYAFNFQAVSPYNGMLDPWGMTRANHLRTPRPVLAALSAANRLIAGSRGRGELDFSTPGLWGVRFSGEDRRVEAFWSDNGPQDIQLHLEEGSRVYDLMGNMVEMNGARDAWVSVGESPLYVVGRPEGAAFSREGLAVLWDAGAVWSGSPLRGRIVLDGVGSGPDSVVSLQLREGPEGPVRWQSDNPGGSKDDAGRTIPWEFPLEAEPGPVEMILEAGLSNGRTVHRRFIPMVLGTQADRKAYETGNPLLVEDFSDVKGDGHRGLSARGITFEGNMFFPWYTRYGPNVKRSLAVENGHARLTVQDKVGPPGRNRPNWPTLDCTFEDPQNWLAYKGLRIRYRMDRENDEGRAVMDPGLSSEGIGVRMLDAEGNVFFTSAGHTGLEYYRDGDWYVAELSFDDTVGLNEKRAAVTFLSLWSVVSAVDEDPFGFSIDRIEAVTELREKEDGPAGAVPGHTVFDE